VWSVADRRGRYRTKVLKNYSYSRGVGCQACRSEASVSLGVRLIAIRKFPKTICHFRFCGGGPS
jgi:hypothetical protein